MVFPGTQGGPLMHVIAAKAVAFEEASTPEFKTYQKTVINNAKLMAKTFADLGYRLVSGGTDTHLFLLDIKGSKGLSGVEVEQMLAKCNIVVNRNSIPFDTESPMVTSGIRIGTPAVTTRGFGRDEVIQIVHWVDEAIKKRDDEQFLAKLKKKVVVKCRQVSSHSV